MFLSAKTVSLSDCHCILTSQLCSCCQTALHINATYVSEASFSSILINKSFIYFSEACQGSAGFAALGWLKPFVHFVSSPLLWSLWATPWVILPPDVTCMLSSNHHRQWTLCISVHALKKDEFINNWSAAHNFSFVFWCQLMTRLLDVHTDNREMCPLSTPFVAEDVWPSDTNSPNNHYAGALQGFNKLENWLASVRSQRTRMYIVYFDS